MSITVIPSLGTVAEGPGLPEREPPRPNSVGQRLDPTLAGAAVTVTLRNGRG